MKQGTQGFKGDRLQLACQMRQISITDLAKKIDVSRQMISQYLSDDATPTYKNFKLIADELEFPMKFFIEENKLPELNSVFYRSMSSATKSQRVSAQSKYIILKEIVNFLNNYIEKVQHSLPDFNIKNPYLLNLDSDIENFAIETREELSLKDGPISNLLLLLENKGVIISAFEMDADGLSAFSEWDAYTGNPFIMLNHDDDDNKAVRMRFNAAHELGHLLLHKNIDKNDLTNKDKFKQIETQVNRFASAFLLPAQSFNSDLKWINLDHFIDLKMRWKVSIQAMIIRCHQLGRIDDQQKENFFININKRGWRKHEPLDDHIETERPVFLTKAFNLLLSNLFSLEELLHHLPYYSKDIQEILYLPVTLLQKNEIDDIIELKKGQLRLIK